MEAGYRGLDSNENTTTENADDSTERRERHDKVIPALTFLFVEIITNQNS